MLRLHASFAGGMSSIPSRGNKIPHATWPKNERIFWKLPGGLVFGLWGFHCHGPGSIPGGVHHSTKKKIIIIKNKVFSIRLQLKIQPIFFNNK